jgi:ATP-binding cassette subfamily B protein
LLLDEATASVDSETEELIQEAIGCLTGQRTILVVAHRLSSVRRADRVIVLDRGRIVESGTPEVLLQSDTRCRDLFAAQLVPGGIAA